MTEQKTRPIHFYDKNDECANLGLYLGAANALIPFALYHCLCDHAVKWSGVVGETRFCRVSGDPETQKKCDGYKEISP